MISVLLDSRKVSFESEEQVTLYIEPFQHIKHTFIHDFI